MMPNWWDSENKSVHNNVLTYVKTLDAIQAHLYNKFARLEYLYDMNPRPGYMAFGDNSGKGDGRMNENVIASNVDTVAAQIATINIRPTFDTDGADWAEQRRARHREWYAEALGKRFNVLEKCQKGFKAGAALKGTGINKVYIDKFKRINVDSVLIDDIIVDELECRNGPPRQMHFRTPMDKDVLKAQFPQFKDKIAAAQSGIGQNPRQWAGYRPLQRNEIMVLESWRLPVGTTDHPDYKTGRHVIVIEGCDLLDEEWTKDFFPFAVMFWTVPPRGWYGIGLAERIAGIQRALNRRNLQIERQLDQGAFPTTFVRQADARLQSMTQNTVGTISVYKSPDPPKTVIPQAVSAETYQDAERLSHKAGEVSGVSRMASQAVKPAGVETGVALREYRDQTTQRFAIQEQGYEKFYLDTIVLILDCCKDLGKDAPEVMRQSRFGSRRLSWAKVDMNDVRIQIGAASTLGRTRAGRLQTVVEWAQAGIISTDDARRLMDHPDLERAMSLYNAAIENVDYCLDEIADGNVVIPEPFMNLKLLVWRAQQQYLNWSMDGAPESVLENLRMLIVQAAWMISNGATTMPGPDMSTGNGGPPLQSGAPMAATPPMGQPTAALASQAMQLQPA